MLNRSLEETILGQSLHYSTKSRACTMGTLAAAILGVEVPARQEPMWAQTDKLYFLWKWVSTKIDFVFTSKCFRTFWQSRCLSIRSMYDMVMGLEGLRARECEKTRKMSEGTKGQHTQKILCACSWSASGVHKSAETREGTLSSIIFIFPGSGLANDDHAAHNTTFHTVSSMHYTR